MFPSLTPSQIKEKVNQDVITVGQKPFAKLPVAKDLPRLGTSFSIKIGQKIVDTSKISQTADKVRSILTTLIETLDSPNDLEKLQKYLPSLDGQNIQGALIELFKGLDDVEGPRVNLNTLRVLKYCNQSIVAPAIVELKLLLREFGYIDGGWTVAVDVQTDWIVVTHTRTELFTAGGNMTWSIRYFLSRSDELRLAKVDLAIQDVNIHNEDDQAKVMKKIDTLYCPAILSACQSVFLKTWTKLPISKDLGRFASVLEIENLKDNSKLSTGDSEMTQVKKVLLYLANNFESDLVTKIDTTFDEQVLKHVNSDKNILIRSYLTDTLQLKDSEPLTCALKLLTHVIISPVAIRLAVDLAKDYQIKDGKGWTIKMVIEKDRVIVTHYKSEVTIAQIPTKAFDFDWKCTFVMNRECTQLIDVDVRIEKVSFHQACPQGTRLDILQTLDLALM
jgi:hypothetical protein